MQRVREAEVSPPCAIAGDWIAAFEDSFAPALAKVNDTLGAPAWQLDRYVATRNLIATRIRRRLSGGRHSVDEDWRGLIDTAVGKAALPGDQDEEAARTEKATALAEVFRSRASALIGPAGTGKTTLLQALLSIPSVRQGGVLLLAPPGRRVCRCRSGQAMCRPSHWRNSCSARPL